jgi:hypothetical protein
MYIHLNRNQKIKGGEFFAARWYRSEYRLCSPIFMIFVCKTGGYEDLFCKIQGGKYFKMYRHTILICLIFVPKVLMAPPPFGLFRPPHTRESGVAK